MVINLFALEGWHIAEALGIPVAVASPTVVPYTPPSSFAKRFRRAYPGLYQSLIDRKDGTPASWREVEHWLWPVFTERWGRWRSERLGLNEVPFLAGGVTTQRPTQLIYGCSPSVIQVPGYWPDTVQACGSWLPPDDWEPDVRVPARLMQDFFNVSGEARNVGSGGGGVVAITLSTVFDMGLLGGADEAKHIIDIVASALKTCGLRGIFIMSKDSCLEAAWNSLYHDVKKAAKKRKLDDADDACDDKTWVGGDGTVQGYVGSIPFQQLFPMCLGALHHGGSGTTAAALRAGIPQIICPCVFDQFFWAERMSWLGVSPAPLKASDLTRSGASMERTLCTAFAFLSRPETQEDARNLQTSVRSEHESVDTAVDVLESVVGVRILRPECSSHNQGVKILELPNGWRVACTSKVEALYLFNEMDAYFRHVSPVADGVIIDVGANIGMFLLAANAWLGRDAGGVPRRARTYLAIEPMGMNAACFTQNVAIHGAADGVELHRCGMTNEANARKGRMDFTYYPHMPGNSTAYPDEKISLQQSSMKREFLEGAEVFSCPVLTLTALLDQFHPGLEKIDLVKLDVEGAELEVLQGLSDKWWTIITQIVVEVHDVNNRVQTVEMLLRAKCFNTTVELHESGSNAWLVWGSR